MSELDKAREYLSKSANLIGEAMLLARSSTDLEDHERFLKIEVLLHDAVNWQASARMALLAARERN